MKSGYRGEEQEMKKREKLENILKDIPCLYEDYQNNVVKRYSLLGRQDMLPYELKGV